MSSVSSEYNLVHKRIHRVFSTALAARWSRLLFSKIVFTGRCENMRVGEARGASAPVPPSVGPVLVRSWGGPFFRGSRTRLATALYWGVAKLSRVSAARGSAAAARRRRWRPARRAAGVCLRRLRLDQTASEPGSTEYKSVRCFLGSECSRTYGLLQTTPWPSYATRHSDHAITTQVTRLQVQSLTPALPGTRLLFSGVDSGFGRPV